MLCDTDSQNGQSEPVFIRSKAISVLAERSPFISYVEVWDRVRGSAQDFVLTGLNI